MVFLTYIYVRYKICIKLHFLTYERLRRQFQQAFGTSSSSSAFERTVEGKIEIINSKTEQHKDEKIRNQYNSFKNNEHMSMSSIQKKDEHYAEMMSIQGII